MERVKFYFVAYSVKKADYTLQTLTLSEKHTCDYGQNPYERFYQRHPRARDLPRDSRVRTRLIDDDEMKAAIVIAKDCGCCLVAWYDV